MTGFPLVVPALRIIQPIGEFYVVVLSADVLLQVASSDVASATLNPDGKGYSLTGTQRLIQDKRLSQIADYIDRLDAAFPNSIVLAANYNRDTGLDQDESEAIESEEDEEREAKAGTASATAAPESKSWTVSQADDGCFRLRIPSGDKLAAIIDGQHRLFAFAKADARTRLDMQLICSVFLDLPKPLQAQLFATINSTQKPVDRSLTFELFGYNVADEPENLWTPDKLAVFLTRKLNTEDSSPLKTKISVAPKRDPTLNALLTKATWRISTAVVVDGILRLISANPKRDANAMRTPEVHARTALRHGRDKSPLRSSFIEGNDNLIYKIVENYLSACNKLFWSDAKSGSYITKTVGVQALFDVLRKVAPDAVTAKDLRVTYFESRLQAASDIDFSGIEFQVPAGKGRSAIRKAIEKKISI